MGATPSESAMEIGMVGPVLAVVAVMIYSGRKLKAINDRGGCPNCSTPVPSVRKPTSFRQFLWGGWTCESCATEMDRNGNELVEN